MSEDVATPQTATQAMTSDATLAAPREDDAASSRASPAAQPDAAARAVGSAGARATTTTGQAAGRNGGDQDSTRQQDTEMHDADVEPADTATAQKAEQPDDDQQDGAAPYGTRSRNRPRGERVNYAEDAELDFEVHPSVEGPGTANNTRMSERDSTSSPNQSARQSPGPIAGNGTGTGSGKKGAAASSAAASAVSKDAAIPGTSSFAANPNASAPAPVSKKRKAAMASNANGANGHVTNGTTGSSRKAAAHAQTAMSNRFAKVYTFDGCGHRLKNEKLVADDGTAFGVDDFVYMVCEPPGEPYYLGRIMEFRHTDLDDPTSPVDSMRINWFYRPRDIMRSSQDTRLLYATMHSDISPITSLRGRPTIRHRDDIEEGVGAEKMALDDYRRNKDHFWFDEVFDRFIHRYYKVVPVRKVVNVPDKVKQALRDRWQYIVVEHNKVKEMTQEGKDCKKCHNFAAPDESVECAVCKNMYHMQCMKPPLLKKPSRGFGWSCAACSRAQERRLEARHTPLMGETTEAEDEELLEEEEVDSGAVNTTAPSPNSSDAEVDLHPGTQAEIRLAKMWPMRYLGIHCRPEDALLYDDRAIYPRASSRLGPRHQANVNVWHGRPVELVKPAEIRKRFAKTAVKKEGKFSKESAAALEADREARAKRPKWVQDEPPGYVARGEDHPNSSKENTAKLLFTMPTFGEHSERGMDDGPEIAPDETTVDEYIRRAKAVAKNKDINESSVDFLDAAVRLFQDSNYDMDVALRGVRNLDPKKDLRDPMRVLNSEEKKRFDEGVAKYGSELRSVRLHCKSVKPGDAVRYWYMWKKTDRGREIWGTYGGRKGLAKKIDSDNVGKLLDDIADDRDDSAFSYEKAESKKRGFCCKFCNSKRSRQWRRAPGVTPGSMVTAEGKPAVKEKTNIFYVALCDRCASFWRRYAIRWEEYEDVAKKIAQGGTKQMRRRIDEEVLQEFRNAAEGSGNDTGDAGYGTPTGGPEPVKKKQKVGDAAATAQGKEKQKTAPPPKLPSPPPPPIQPAQPRFRDLPCAVCDVATETGDPTVVVCLSCKLTVHRNCYGVSEQRSAKWTCDTCTNDRKETVSYDYNCVLCPVEDRQWHMVESPRVTHKKKGDREKEKERLEKELVDGLERSYKLDQVAKGRPPVPREALKRTAANNWVHLTCAVWTSETKFGDVKALDLVEGIPQIPKAKYEQVCKICKKSNGACVPCHQCHTTFHVGCAQQAGYILGFDITPVKGSRRDSTNYVTFGNEAGQATAAIWCREHSPKTIIHYPNEVVDEQGTFALQRYVSTFKQADLTLTGTTRKANLLDESAKNLATVASVSQVNRRTSTTTSAATTGRGVRTSNAGLPSAADGMELRQSPGAMNSGDRRCEWCEIDTSPRWYRVQDRAGPDGHEGLNGTKHDPVRDVPMVNGHSEHHKERWHCQKCHWRKANGQPLPEPSHKREREREQAKAQQSSPKPPAALQDPWNSAQPPRGPHMQHNIWHPPPHSAAAAAVPPQQSMPQTSAPPGLYRTNSIPQHPHPHHQQVAPPPPPGHAINHFVHAGPPPPPSYHRSPHPPPPLNLSHPQIMNPLLPNGLPSPSSAHHRVAQQHSPTGPPPHLFPPAPRAEGSPFGAHRLPSYVGPPPPQHHGPQPVPHHGSPPPGSVRPSTPREHGIAGAAPLGVREPSVQPAGGASASPSLRNLLH